MSIEKKLKTSSAAERPMIDLTSSNGKKNEVARSERVMSAMLKMASTIVDKIAHRRGKVLKDDRR